MPSLTACYRGSCLSHLSHSPLSGLGIGGVKGVSITSTLDSLAVKTGSWTLVFHDMSVVSEVDWRSIMGVLRGLTLSPSCHCLTQV